MSTRCITIVRSQWADAESKPIATIYRHHDGYPSVHGVWLVEFLQATQLINGIPYPAPERYANGAGHLAARLIADLQSDGHSPKLMQHGIKCWQEYTYIVDANNTTLAVKVTVLDGPMTAFGDGGDNCTNEIFSGSIDDFSSWLKIEGTHHD